VGVETEFDQSKFIYYSLDSNYYCPEFDDVKLVDVTTKIGATDVTLTLGTNAKFSLNPTVITAGKQYKLHFFWTNVPGFVAESA
jgi:hypothetical protein